MLFTFWRKGWSNRKAGAASLRTGKESQKRTILSVERLEERDLLTSFSPLYALTPQATTPFANEAPSGYTPSQVRQAYGFNQITFSNGTIQGDGSGQTIAIVDAYDSPTIASDLHQFDLAFGLPDPVFTKVNQRGGSDLPPPNSDWAIEIALDVEWAHAIAPGANILLVEADSNNESDLFAAVQYAASQPGVSVVSMSWGSVEFASETDYDNVFSTPSGHSGVTFVASSGDQGAPVSYPAVSPNVLAVGGTRLNLTASSNYGSESGWTGSGGGVSVHEPQPNYQHGVVSQSATHRVSPDVSYNADPSTGFAVYSSYNNPTPWVQVGGTSAGAPQWAALVAIANQGRAVNGLGTLSSQQALSALYQLPASDFHDILSGGSNGTPNYAAGSGFDLVTGRGSPSANLIVNALSQQTVGGKSGGASGGEEAPVSAPVHTAPAPTPVTGTSPVPTPQPSPSDPFVEIARDAQFIAQGWLTGNYSLLLAGWQDFLFVKAAHPSLATQLTQALLYGVLAELL